MTGVRFSVGAGKGFVSFRHRIQACSEAHLSTIQWVPGALSPG